MSYDVTKLTRLKHLQSLANRIKTGFATKGELSPVSEAAASAFKSGRVEGSTVSLYTTADQSGDAAFSFDFPAEMFLDQAKTAFIPSFAWGEEAYPGSADPGLEGKPVMALAVKGSDGSVAYSFLDMAALVDTYKAKGEGKDASTTVTVSGYEVEVKVNVSAEADNLLQVKDDGLYVAKQAVDVSGKADKAAGAAAGNFAALDGDGNLADSGKKPSDYSKVEAGSADGTIKVDGTDIAVVTIATDAEAAEMLDEVFGAAE